MGEFSDDDGREREKEGIRQRKKALWDIFEVLPPEKDSDLDEDQTVYNFTLRVLKLLTYIVVFVIVLGSAVTSKITTMLMTSQLRKNDDPISCCNKIYGSNLDLVVHSDQTERIAWVWALYFVFMVPEIQTFFRSLRIILFKGMEKPTKIEFFLPLLFETLHTIGLALFVYTVLPTMDAARAAMLTNGMCIVPGILGMLSRGYDPQWMLKNLVDVIVILFQLSVMFVWPLFSPLDNGDKPWLLSISALLISFGWWENFVEPQSPFPLVRGLGHLKIRLRRTRYWSYAFISLWKMAVFLLMLVVSVKINEGSWSVAFDRFHQGFDYHDLIIEETRPPVEDTQDKQPVTPVNDTFLKPGQFPVENVPSAVLWTMGVQIVSTYICYIFGKLACRICIQTFSFSFPILLAVPTTITALVSLCGIRNDNVCFWNSLFPGYLWWTCPEGEFWSDYFVSKNTWVWVLWLLSQTWITLHIWYPKGHRLAKTEVVFATPMYNAFLIDQTLALNRRRDEDSLELEDELGIGGGGEVEELFLEDDVEAPRHNENHNPNKKPEDTVPKIYACATMWHEIPEEMIEMLKSIFRMDVDQCARRIARKHFKYNDPSYYEFETHIFFDDAFELSDGEDIHAPMQINSFVRDFIGQMEEAAIHVHQSFIKLRRPKKIPTPYGGRLEWVLPGRTKLICHLKDKDKIRHKKRWSQVMYMYYLLGLKLTDRSDLPLDRKEVIAENTYILALDGDIDFQPKAVELLVDLMKKNRNLGAACGRIHPIGGGPMVWYQKFEYAVGHWFQKATEHVFGCVLCSPGCFSLFRAKALMDYNVMKRYTTTATEPRHYVQYDQGEDRWLCTLLLQRGWRVEYSAASDAKTHAPEGFREFYNQRRRWVPSTMANIMDLLLDGKRTVKQNPDISYPYIMYQIFLMVGSILGPGSIFLMLVGAFAVAFKLDQWTSFFYNFIPILAFILICFLCKPDIQLMFAEILTTIYALAMVAVVVAIILQINDDGIMAPSSLFLMIIAGSFIIAGLVHPLEFWCLPHGFIYYITIPSMYLLLMIYSLFNLNVVSWGTRETPLSKAEQELAEQKKLEKAKKELEKKKKKGLLGSLLPGFGVSGGGKDGGGKKEGSFQLSFAGLFKLVCCVIDKPDTKKEKLDTIAVTVNEVNDRLQKIEKGVDKQVRFTRRMSMGSVLTDPLIEEDDLDDVKVQGGSNGGSGADKVDGDGKREKEKRDDLMNPFWLDDKDLSGFKVDFLSGPEIVFWKDMIKKYLLPLKKDDEAEEKMAQLLIDLRNKVAFTFIMCNAVFVILVFLLQLEKASVHINWPLNVKNNVTYKPLSEEVEVTFEYLELEPIGLVFVLVFGFVLATQFFGMMVHRLGTFLHIMAMTTLDILNKHEKSNSNDVKKIKEGIGLIKELQKGNIEEAKKEHERSQKRKQSVFQGRRMTIRQLEQGREEEKPVHDLQSNFNVMINNPELLKRKSVAFSSDRDRRTLKSLVERRSTVLGRRGSASAQRRGSTIFGDNPPPPTGIMRPRADSLTPSMTSDGSLAGGSRQSSNRLFEPRRKFKSFAFPKKNASEEIEMKDKKL